MNTLEHTVFNLAKPGDKVAVYLRPKQPVLTEVSRVSQFFFRVAVLPKYFFSRDNGESIYVLGNPRSARVTKINENTLLELKASRKESSRLRLAYKLKLFTWENLCFEDLEKIYNQISKPGKGEGRGP